MTSLLHCQFFTLRGPQMQSGRSLRDLPDWQPENAPEPQMTPEILAVNFSVLRPRKNDITVTLSLFLRSGVRKCSLVDPLVPYLSLKKEVEAQF